MWFGRISGKKRANRKSRLAYILCEQNAFTNNVSWLGDPRLKKGHLY